MPAFGSWDWNDNVPFTQCFESARQAGLLRYSYSEDRDLYVTGDLYENDVVKPAMIVVPRRRVSPNHSKNVVFLFIIHFLSTCLRKREVFNILTMLSSLNVMYLCHFFYGPYLITMICMNTLHKCGR